MNRDYFSIETHEYGTYGKCSNSQWNPPTPESKREAPCDTCPMADECENAVLECVAFRQWSASGDYMDKDIGRLRRAAK